MIGGLIGALTSKFAMDRLGRKNSIIFHLFFGIAGSIALFASSRYASSQACVGIFSADADHSSVAVSSGWLGPILLKLGRFLQGVQGGLSCSVIPTYLSEIAPSKLRGQTGVIHNLFLTLGLLTSQILGFEGLLGNCSNWYYLVALPLFPAVLGVPVLFLFFEESPKYLYHEKEDQEAATKGNRYFEALTMLFRICNFIFKFSISLNEAKEYERCFGRDGKDVRGEEGDE